MTDHHLQLAIDDHEAGGHSVFAPSSSAMWLTCSGSLLANLAAQDDAGYEAAEGTVAHDVGEHWLKTGERPDHRVGDLEWVQEGDQIFWIEITKEMLDFVQEYVDWCMYLPGDKFVEKRVYFSRLTPLPKQGGTADHFACEPGRLTITDLKYGIGEAVFAEENTQAMLYALGVFFEWDWLYNFQEIVIRIAQPRRDNMDVWVTTRDRLMEFAGFVVARAALAWIPNAPRTPSVKGCRWCKVKSTCPAFLKLMEDLADDSFDDVTVEISEDAMQAAMKSSTARLDPPTLVKPIELSLKHLVKINDYRDVFSSFFDGVYAELESRATDGEIIPRHKLVQSRTNRDWHSEKEALKALREAGVDELEFYSLKTATPAQMEDRMKALGWKKAEAVKALKGAVGKPAGKPVLVSIADRRQAIGAIVDESFDDVSGDL